MKCEECVWPRYPKNIGGCAVCPHLPGAVINPYVEQGCNLHALFKAGDKRVFNLAKEEMKVRFGLIPAPEKKKEEVARPPQPSQGNGPRIIMEIRGLFQELL